jgi:AraC-like DNA-binding protein
MSVLSANEICYKTGFSSQSHFASVFHKKTGMAPRDYRLRHQSGKSETKKHAGPGPEGDGR